MSSVTFRKAYTALWTNEGGLSVSGGTFENCSNSAYLGGPGPIVFSGNTLKNSGNPAFSLSGGALTLSGNLMPGATVRGEVRTFSHSGNRAPSGRCDILLQGVTLTGDNAWPADAGERVRSSNTLTVASGATLMLAPGSALFFDDHTGYYNSLLQVDGALRASGEGSGPATITETPDETPFGGPDNAHSDYYGTLYWQGVVVGAGGSADLSGLLVRHASVGVAAETLSANNASFQMCQTAIQVSNGGGVLRNCSFTGNGFAINNLGTVDVDARGCWFGDPSGPYNANSNPNGRGNPVSDHVLFGDVPAVLTASVTLQSYLASAVAGTTVTVELRLPGTTTAVESHVATLDAQGNLTLALTSAPGTYDVTIKGSHWLRRVVRNVVVSGSGASVGPVSLINGDANGDNYVNVLDRGLVTGSIGTASGDPGFNPNADLNGDGYVNVLDRGIATSNIGNAGDE